MLRYLLFSIGATLLLGCQASNPYQAQGLPLPAAPANAATHFDNSAYPAALLTKPIPIGAGMNTQHSLYTARQHPLPSAKF